MRVVVTGGREFGHAQHEQVFTLEWLDRFVKGHDDVEFATGEARGVDTLVKTWCKFRGVTFRGYPAKWKTYGSRAGNIRNGEMLREEKPDLVIAFPGGSGTADCVKKAKRMKLRVVSVYYPFPCAYNALSWETTPTEWDNASPTISATDTSTSTNI